MLEFLNTSESKLNIVTMSPSSDTRIPSDGELGRKWLYLKKDNTSYGFEPTILQPESFYFSAGWTELTKESGVIKPTEIPITAEFTTYRAVSKGPGLGISSWYDEHDP